MPKFTIRHRYNNSVLFEVEADSFVRAVEQAVKEKANLRYSDLSGSNLRYSDLSGSNLRGSHLRDSDLSGSDLSGSNLSGSNLTPIRDDLWAVLSSAPSEVLGLKLALIEGRVDGSAYCGECACLLGTIANIQGKSIADLEYVKPNSSRLIELFFLGIKIGDNPKTNQISKQVVEWIDQWIENVSHADWLLKLADHLLEADEVKTS